MPHYQWIGQQGLQADDSTGFYSAGGHMPVAEGSCLVRTHWWVSGTATRNGYSQPYISYLPAIFAYYQWPDSGHDPDNAFVGTMEEEFVWWEQIPLVAEVEKPTDDTWTLRHRFSSSGVSKARVKATTDDPSYTLTWSAWGVPLSGVSLQYETPLILSMVTIRTLWWIPF